MSSQVERSTAPGRPPHLLLALAPIVATILLLLLQLVVFEDFTPHVPLILGIVLTGVMARLLGYRWAEIEDGIFHGIKIGMPSLSILIIVGMVIGTWILSGTVPVMIYYGLELLSPGSFLVAAAVICSVISLATGTSWGTVGTVGLALVGIGDGMGIPLPLVGGAIVSGAFFGDKMSPLSDTTNLAPAVAGTDLFSHIRHMVATTVPAMILALIVYWWLGLRYADAPMDSAGIALITSKLASSFQLSLWLLWPAVLVIGLAVTRMPAMPSLFAGVVGGGITAMAAQGASLHDVFNAMQSGYVSGTGVESVDKLLSKGGIQSMMWTVSLVLTALGFGGLLEKTRCLESIVSAVIKLARGRFGLITSSVATAMGVNLVAGDPYLSIALPGRMFASAYRGMGLSTKNLSRAVEDGGTLFSPLVPWNAGGAYVASTLGIPTIAYMPFAFANWLSPLISCLYGATGWFITPADAEERKRWQEENEEVLEVDASRVGPTAAQAAAGGARIASIPRPRRSDAGADGITSDPAAETPKSDEGNSSPPPGERRGASKAC